MAFKAAMRAAKQNGSLLPPKHILNAPTKLMKSEGYGDGYRYDHDEPDAFLRPGLFPRKPWAARPSTIRPSAASSARSASGWSMVVEAEERAQSALIRTRASD
jgi:replication-associated recombination protein RarA